MNIEGARMAMSAAGGWWAEKLLRHFRMAGAGFGILLCVVIVALEFAYYFPLVPARGGLGFEALGALLITWVGECVLFGLLVGFVERRAAPRDLHAWELVLTVAGGAFAAALVWNAFGDYVLRDQLGMRLFVDHVGQPAGWVGRVFYHGWMMSFFGGLALAVHASQRRHVRMLRVLREAELGRATSQQRLAEVTLGALRARIDPEFVFRTLSDVGARYEANHPEADCMLEELIDFLRAALADIEHPAATAAPDRAPAGRIARDA